MPAYGSVVVISRRVLGVLHESVSSVLHNVYISSELNYTTTATIPRTTLKFQELYVSGSDQVMRVKFQFDLYSGMGDLLHRNKYVTS